MTHARQVPKYIVLDYAKRTSMIKERGTPPAMASTVTVNVRLEYGDMPGRPRCSYREHVTAVRDLPTVNMQFHTRFHRPVRVLPRRSLKGKRCATALMVELEIKGPYRLLHFMQRAASKKEVATCVQRYAELEMARS